MLKSVTALFGTLIAAWILVGSATSATAGSGYGHRHHGCCGPIPPTYHYKTKNIYKHVTRYSDVWRTRYVPRIHRIVHVTRYQPIINIHKVKRIHTKIVGVVHNRYQHVSQWLPAKKYVSVSVRHYTHCGCSSHSHY
jgi:hypothetical protein